MGPSRDGEAREEEPPPLEGGAPPGPDPGPEPTPRLPEALCRCSGERGRQTGVRQGRGRGARGGGDGGERTRAKEGFVASGRPEVGSLKPLGQKPELPCRCSGGQGRWKAKWWKVEDGRRPRLPCCHRPIRALGDGVAPHRPTPDSTNRLNNSMTMRRTERQARRAAVLALPSRYRGAGGAACAHSRLHPHTTHIHTAHDT